ncbi:MAG: hypothetical protein M1833_006135 [Piccolia ochrophora]|nr:MAG: hypothetical protein M1833_006135 [Piccolia ochrophora]
MGRHSLPPDFSSAACLLEKGRIRCEELNDFFARQEQTVKKKEAVHVAALKAAAAEHERVRESADALRRALEAEAARLEAQKRLEQLQRERAERTQRESIERERRAEEDRAREAAVKKEEEDTARKAAIAERHAQKERADAEAAETAEAARAAEHREQLRKATELAEADRARQEAQSLQPLPQPRPPEYQQSVGVTRPQSTDQGVNQERLKQHASYVELHKRLKQFRKYMMDSAKQNPPFKKMMGDMRREIRKCVGQLTDVRGANKAQLNQVMSLLRTAAQDTDSPRIDPQEFIVTSPHQPIDPARANAPGDYPSLLLYLLNIFSKAIISQFISEAGVAPKTADPVGVVAVQVFAQPDFQWRGSTLIDVLIAKFHVVCPVLFGVHGNEGTEAGRARLGWWRDESGWVSEQRHAERMTGLGAGYASIALRNFEKSKMNNPYPNRNYWQSLQSVISVPPQGATPTHFVVLKAMVENYEARILDFYGTAGVALLKTALVDFPRTAGRNGVAANAVATLPDVLRRDKKFTLR